MEGRIPARLTPAEGRRFAFPVGTAFLLLAGVLWWRDRVPLAEAFAGVGGLLWMAGTLIPGRLGLVYRAWMHLAHLISKVTTPIFMGVVYFGVMFPMGLLRRTLGSNQMIHPKESGTYWQARETGSRKGDLKRQF